VGATGIEEEEEEEEEKEGRKKERKKERSNKDCLSHVSPGNAFQR
jgi:hypothetical protein